ncbi:MAG TPA: ATP-binding protein [Patescibacteria group bacterium]|nr:ATP-binding protein [Patescibacteria group bacterium]
MKIAQKLLFAILAMSLLLLTGAGLPILVTTQHALRTQIQTSLDNTANHQLERIETLNKSVAVEANDLAFKSQLRILLDQYNAAPSDKAQADLNAALVDVQNSQGTFHRLYVTNPQGRVVGSTDSSLLGQDYSGTKVFRAGGQQANTSLFVRSATGELDQYIAVPLTLLGRPIGMAIAEATAASYLVVARDYSELGTTGESYLTRPLGNGHWQYLTRLRFKNDAALTTASGPPTSTTDYRNHTTLLTTKAVPGTDWVLVAKIDTAEVDAPVMRMRTLLLGVLGVAAGLAVLVAWYLSRTMTNPIKRFTEVVGRIRAGNLNERVQVKSRDEIGALGNAFNEMTSSLLESRARLIASILSLSQGFVMIDQAGNIITVNVATRRLLKLPTTSKESDYTMKSLFGRMEKFDIAASVSKCLQDKKSIEARDVAFEGSFFNIFISPILQGEQARGVVVLISDETEERIIQRSRDEFFSIASHELRTPLTAIRGNTDMILNYYPEQMKDPDLQAMMADMHDSSIRLIDIVNNFLDMSSLEQGKAGFAIAPFDPLAVAKSAVAKVEKTAAAKQLSLKLTAPKGALPPKLMGDQERVQKILVALLDNAVKFTERGSITITLEPTATALQFDVADTGRGISPEAQKLLFHKFQQATASILTRDDTSATGLGLYISRLMAQGMQGKLYLKRTELGKGTVFTLELPLNGATPQPPAAEKPPLK